MYLTLLPAYGRDYKSKKLIIDDLNNNKDFLESTSLRAINKQQFKELNISSFNVRYDQHRKITNIKVEDTIKETREVDFDEMGVHKSNIYNFDLLEPGMEFTGPAIVEDPSTTVVIFPKQKCKVDKFANLHISIGGENSE